MKNFFLIGLHTFDLSSFENTANSSGVNKENCKKKNDRDDDLINKSNNARAKEHEFMSMNDTVFNATGEDIRQKLSGLKSELERVNCMISMLRDMQCELDRNECTLQTVNDNLTEASEQFNVVSEEHDASSVVCRKDPLPNRKLTQISHCDLLVSESSNVNQTKLILDPRFKF